MSKIVIRVENGYLTQEEITQGLKSIKDSYESIEKLPDNIRRTEKTIKTLTMLYAFEGLLRGLQRNKEA